MSMPSWSVAPILRVRDVRAAAAYYRDQLGFDCPEDAISDGIGDEGAVYAIARRGSASIHLGRARTSQSIEPGERPNAQGAYFFVPDAHALFAELRERGAIVVQEPARAPWGYDEFVVRDVDGYQISFGSPP